MSLQIIIWLLHVHKVLDEVECSLWLVKRENVPTPSHDHLHKLVHCPHIPGNIISYLPHLLRGEMCVCVCVCVCACVRACVRVWHGQ